ncbi:MAG: 3-deoxy-manno-octulosonate-8-phosphatase KdsC [Nitrospirae bacterium]|nr:MAG: 3-deoxy-manno-octulosonate-8-phosphatase KdsC [Nitrospirota bacterium]
MDERIRTAASKVKLLILDVDGVLTDGRIILDNEGNEFKAFHVRDGHGIKLLVRNGVEVAIITGRRSRVVQRRAEELGIKDVYQKCFDKVVAYNDLKSKHALTDEEICYVGDDIVDIPVMRRVGFPVAVSDADPEISRHAIMVTSCGGGRGAVREVAEVILKAKGLWEKVINGYNKA